MTLFSNVYKLNLSNYSVAEFYTDDIAIQFANEHDWSKETLYDKDYYVDHYEKTGTSKDDKIDIYFDFDMNSYFFVYSGFITNKNIFKKIGHRYDTILDKFKNTKQYNNKKGSETMKIVKYKIVDTFFNGTDSFLIEPRDIDGFNIFPADGFDSEQEAENALFEYFKKLIDKDEYIKCGLVVNPTYTIIKLYGWNPAK